MRYSHGLEYKISKSGVAVLFGIGNCADEHINVPPEVEGYPEVGIGEKAFARCNQIKSVSLPLSVTYICNSAFAWCRHLCEIKSLNLIEIGDRAFMGCDRLSNVSFGNKLTSIGNKAFAYCPSIFAVALPNSLTRLGSAAFEVFR